MPYHRTVPGPTGRCQPQDVAFVEDACTTGFKKSIWCPPAPNLISERFGVRLLRMRALQVPRNQIWCPPAPNLISERVDVRLLRLRASRVLQGYLEDTPRVLQGLDVTDVSFVWRFYVDFVSVLRCSGSGAPVLQCSGAQVCRYSTVPDFCWTPMATARTEPLRTIWAATNRCECN